MITPVLRLDHEDALSRAADVLRAGGIVGIPTETVYGLAVLEGQTQALERLRCLKGRDWEKPFQRLIADLEDILSTGACLSDPTRRLAARFWPGPLTLVLPTDAGGTVGLRMPDFDALRALIRLAGAPLVATSANHAGEPPAVDAETVRTQFDGRIELILDGGPSAVGMSSSVVQITEGAVTVLRQGPLPAQELERVAQGH